MINKQTVIVGASGTASFGKHMGELLECPYIEAVSGKFPNEELKVTVPEAGETTILLGSLSRPVNTRVIEYLLMADAIKRMGCRHIVGALSWFAYSKQDKVFLPGEPLSAKVIATILQDVSLKELVTLELHNPSIAGYFDIPVTNVSATPIFITHFKQQDLNNTMVVSPDAGSIKNSTKVADSLGVPIAYAAKQRDLHTGKVTVTEINQSIENKDILIFDDMVASGSTLIEVAQFLKGRGARKISVCVTHHLYLDGVQEKLDNSPIDEFITTNSIEKPSTLSSNKLKVLDIAPIMVAGLK